MSDDDWRLVLARIADPDALDASARAHGALKRRREVRDGQTLLRLALAYGPGGQSLRGEAAWAEASGVAALSDVALLKRLRASADWLDVLCGAQLARLAEGAAPAGDAPRCLRLVDGTRIAGPGGRAWRLHLAYDLPAGRLRHLELTDIHGAEALERAPVAPGEIRLADRVYARPDGLRHELSAGGDLIVRLSWKSLRLLDRAGAPFDLTAFLAACPADGAAAAVWVGKARGGATWQPLALRLIAIRKPKAARRKSRERARRASRRNGTRLDARTLAAADYLLLLTSLPAERYPAQAVAGLYRLRWQIELAVKRLKSLLHIDRLPAKDPQLARTWLTAHLLAALAIEGLCQEALDSPP